MKITKRQLKRIIKEESTRLLNEQAGGDTKRILYDVLIPALQNAGISGPEVIKTLHDAADLFEAEMREMFG
jgi:hypothetical protein